MEYFATSNGLPIHISDTKSGKKTIFLLHGYLETLYIFTEFAELLSRQGFRVVSIDLPGHGLSGSNPSVNKMQFCADTAYDVLKNICKIDSAIIAGHSLGGYIAQLLTIRYPDIVEKLFLLNSMFFVDDDIKKQEREREISAILNFKLVTLASLSIPKMYAPENLRKFDSKIEETIEICETHDPVGMAATIRGIMERDDITSALSRVQKPIISLYGDKDICIEKETIDRISSILTDRTSHRIIVGCGHNSFIESPDAVLKAIIE